MSRAQNKERSQKHAEYLRTHKITRDTGMCPMGCGRPIKNGGNPLIYHLQNCRGKRK